MEKKHSKGIRLTDGCYTALDAIREKRESFSETVERLIRVYATMRSVSDTLGPSHYLKERPKEGNGKETAANR